MLMITGGWRVANLWQIGQVRRARGPMLWPLTWVTNVWPGPHLASNRQNIRPDDFSSVGSGWQQQDNNNDRLSANGQTYLSWPLRMQLLSHFLPSPLSVTSSARSFFSPVAWSLIIPDIASCQWGDCCSSLFGTRALSRADEGPVPPCPKVVMMAINPSPALFTTPDTANLKMIAT